MRLGCTGRCSNASGTAQACRLRGRLLLCISVVLRAVTPVYQALHITVQIASIAAKV